MHYLQNHCWCSKSHWDEQMYDCRHIVSFNSYENKYKDDWEALVDPDAEKFFNKEEFDRMVNFLVTVVEILTNIKKPSPDVYQI